MDNLSSAPAANTLRQRLVEDMTVRGFSELDFPHFTLHGRGCP